MSPKLRRCPECGGFVIANIRLCPFCENQAGPMPRGGYLPSDFLGGVEATAGRWTLPILGVHVACYLLLVAWSLREGRAVLPGLDPRTLIDLGGLTPDALSSGEWWRLVVAGFLSRSLFHLLATAWVLYDLGRQAETIFGSSRMASIYLIANFTGLAMAAAGSRELWAGAGAAVFGIIGALWAVGMLNYPVAGWSLIRVYFWWAFFGLIIGRLLDPDNTAHWSGLAAGLICGFVLSPRRSVPPTAGPPAAPPVRTKPKSRRR